LGGNVNIKKLLCSAVVISTLAFSNVSALETSLGVKGGVNLTKFYGAEEVNGSDPYKYQKVKPGMAIGAALQLKITNMFAIEPEVLFSQKGQVLSGSLLGQDIKATTYLNYIEVPVLAQFLIPVPVQVITPIVYMGPAFALKAGKIDGKTENGNITTHFSDEWRTNADEYISGFDFGFAFGGGAQFKVGPGNIIFDIRYTLGLTNTNKLTDQEKADGFTESDLQKDKNGALMFATGYLFTF
jgi:hypothetical protein